MLILEEEATTNGEKKTPLFHCDFARGQAVGLEITHVASCKGARLTSEHPQVYI